MSFQGAQNYLLQALKYSNNPEGNFEAIKESLYAAYKEVANSEGVSQHVVNATLEAIGEALAYAQARSNPAPFAPSNYMNAPPISPYQTSANIGPYGMMQAPLFPSQPDLVPTAWTPKFREDRTLQLMITKALNLLRQGL